MTEYTIKCFIRNKFNQNVNRHRKLMPIAFINSKRNIWKTVVSHSSRMHSCYWNPTSSCTRHRRSCLLAVASSSRLHPRTTFSTRECTRWPTCYCCNSGLNEFSKRFPRVRRNTRRKNSSQYTVGPIQHEMKRALPAIESYSVYLYTLQCWHWWTLTPSAHECTNPTWKEKLQKKLHYQLPVREA